MTQQPRLCGLRQIVAAFAIVLYLSTLALHLIWQGVGKSTDAAFAYFFTWDMFPYYYTWSSRRTAIGKTDSGKYIEVHPSSSQKFRGGVERDLTRADLDRSGRVLRRIADKTIERTAAAQSHDPVRHVWLLEEYWPEKFNLRDNLYQEFWGAHPHRTYWRTLSEYEIPSTAKIAVGKAAGKRSGTLP